MYNQDFDDDGNPPEAYAKFRGEVDKLDGFLFVTPEYNRSVPAVLKNALDVGSRPYGHNVWNGKSSGIISVSLDVASRKIAPALGVICKDALSGLRFI